MKNDSIQPQLVKFTKKNKVVKDYQFYKGNENLWNKFPHMNKKFYSQYHQLNHKKEYMITSKLQEEEKGKEYNEKLRQRYIESKKIEDKTRHYKRAEEREIIQNQSKQGYLGIDSFFVRDNLDSLDELVAKKTNAIRYSRLNENSWNYHQGLSKKYVKQTLTPFVLKGEEYRIKVVKDSLRHDQTKEEHINQMKLERINEIREELVERREQNSKTLQKLSLISHKSDCYINDKPKLKAYSPNILSLRSQKTDHQSRRDSMQNYPFQYTGLQQTDEVSENIDSGSRGSILIGYSRTGPDVERLAVPKQVRFL